MRTQLVFSTTLRSPGLLAVARLALGCSLLCLLLSTEGDSSGWSSDLPVGLGSGPDAFLSYKIKDSRGSLCSADALQNVGGTCEGESGCGGVEDETDFCVPKGFRKGLRVSLTDAFESGIFDVQKPVDLSTPANLNGEGVGDPATLLEGYRIKLSRTAPRQLAYEKRTDLRVQSRLHPPGNELVLDAIKVDRLLVPTATSITGPISPPDPTSHRVDHYKCYTAKTSRGAPAFAPIRGVAVVDSSEQTRLYDLEKPTRLCTPAEETLLPGGTPEVVESPSTHLVCYRAVRSRTVPPQPRLEKVQGLFVNNQFGPERLDTVQEGDLCVPSTVLASTGCALGAAQSCYDGPSGTDGVGPCTAGTQTCLADGSFGPCEGQVLPGTEVPGNAVDEDCDGRALDCTPGATAPCYGGPAGTEGVGICRAGTRTCDSNGVFGACAGQVLPAAEIPDDGIDEDCDGSDQTGADLPPDPATVAPPLDRSAATTVASSTEFLYTGPSPIQTGVAPGTIEPRRAAVVRGKVLARGGVDPQPGVTISVSGHPELGQTLSRADGMFDLAVNGGGLLTITYEKDGFLPAQRQVHVPWQDYVVAPDVIVMRRDAQVTAVDLTADVAMQAARGTEVSDRDGSRRATVLVPQGTEAEVLLPGGGTQPVSTLHIRLTEYTVGPDGPEAMPAPLPPTSAYTYAVEISADEAVAKIGGRDVLFSQPVFFYLENFLHFPVGGVVPVGFYDRDKGAWTPSDNGRIIQVVGISGDLADLDTDGDGSPDDGGTLAVTDAERRQLAALYAPGESLWRVPIRHFSTWDCNWPYGLPPDADRPDRPDPRRDPANRPPEDQTCEGNGSIIECQNQTLGERVPVSGTPFTLNYRSDRVPARREALSSLKIDLSGADLPPGLRRIELDIRVAGRVFQSTFPPGPGLTHVFVWDGRDAYGRFVQGAQQTAVSIGYVYDGAAYRSPAAGSAAFARVGGANPIGDPLRQELTLWQVYEAELGAIVDLKPLGLGTWSLDVHHVYDPTGQALFRGDGSRRSTRASIVDQVIDNVAFARGTAGVTMTPDGSIWVAETGQHRILRVTPQGDVTTAAGTGLPGCGGPASATQHRLNTPTSVAPGPGGIVERIRPGEGGAPVVVEVPRPVLYITDSFCNQIHELTPDGFIHTIAGTGVAGYDGDEIPADSARLNRPQGIAVAPDGALYVADTDNHRIRRIEPGRDGFLGDGIITTVAGTGVAGFSGDGGPAALAQLSSPAAIAVGDDGSLYVADAANHRIRRIAPDGVITTVAGTGVAGWSGDFGPATAARLNTPAGVLQRPDGTLLVADTRSDRVRQVGPGDFINTVAGGGLALGPGGPASAAQLLRPTALHLLPDQSFLVADSGHGAVRRIGSVLPTFAAGELSIASEDGRELHVFDVTGRHLSTVHALTGATLYRFTYDVAGALIAVTDGDDNVTTIERDAAGQPVAIRSPYGQRTLLAVDANGYLARITNPAGELFGAEYTPDGLLTRFTDPRGNASRMTYDALGRLVRDEDAAGGFTALARERTDAGFEVTKTTAEGAVTTYLVETPPDGQHRVNVFPDGTQNEGAVGSDGTQQLVLADGTTIGIAQGPDPRFGMQAPVTSLLVTTSPGGLASIARRSRTATLADPSDVLSLHTQTDTWTFNDRPYTSTYEAAARTFTELTPAGRQISLTLDAQGRPLREEVVGIAPLARGYDSHGRLTSLTAGTGPDARTFEIAYDAAGDPVTVTDPLGRVRRFVHDAAGRVVREILPDDRAIAYGHDGSGNVTEIVPPEGAAHTLAYSPVGLLTSVTAPDVGTGATETRYSYDRDRRLTRVVLPDARTVDISYDLAGRPTNHASPDGQISRIYDPTTGRLGVIAAAGGVTLSYGYDGARPTSETWTGPVSGVVSRGYDDEFRPFTEVVDGSDFVVFHYDADGLLLQAGDLSLSRDPQHGSVTGTLLGSVTDTRTYDGFGDLASYTAAANGTALYAVQHLRDPRGRLTRKTETIAGVTDTYDYAYDLAGRLSEVRRNGVVVATYGYDGNDNRLSHTTPSGATAYTYDAQDRLVDSTGTVAAAFEYTANGELSSKTSSGQTTTYRYDVFGNLRDVTLPDGARIEYVVDGRNRRIGKRVDGALVQGFLYRSRLQPVAELDGANAVVSRFVYGSETNVPDYMIRDGLTYRILSDHLGSPRLVVDTATGAIVQRMDYDEFGNVTSDTNPGFQPFGFAGGLYDPDTRLTRFGVRDYDAASGRWTAKDPLGFVNGPNLYCYIHDDPMNLTDPSGKYAPPSANWSIARHLLSEIIETVDPDVKDPAEEPRPYSDDFNTPPPPVIVPLPVFPDWDPSEEPTDRIPVPPVPPTVPEALAFFLMCLALAGAFVGG